MRATRMADGERIARRPVDLLWCTSNPKSGRNGWEFPKQVREVIMKECEGLTVLHIFGGMADFGVRLDIDPLVRPHVIGDAWLPPFARDSFDVVVMDPPYVGEGFHSISNRAANGLFTAAAWIARKRVIWFSHIWEEAPARCTLERGWLVRVGRRCTVRAIQVFAVPSPDRKATPLRYFRRGPAMRYNRWMVGQQPLIGLGVGS